MRSFMGMIRTAVRIVLGAVLLCVGIVSVLSTLKDWQSDLPANASAAYVSGWIIGSIMFPLIIGVVGFKMMTGRRAPQ